MAALELLAEAVASTSSVVGSSLGVPFVVVSDQQLVESLPALPESDHADLVARLEAVVSALEAEQKVLLADFEGEMTGFGGELVTAAFLPTGVLDRENWQAIGDADPAPAGLLLDLRSPGGHRLVQRVMESEAIAKVIWGADGDLTSLRHQHLPFALGVASKTVVDAQLAFSPPTARLGMARMLERVPQDLIKDLPRKESINFDLPHSVNRRALQWPLSLPEARYAVDDVHRLEAVLRSQSPPSGGYAEAFAVTDQVLERIESDPDGLNWLRRELVWFERKRGVRRRAQAVQLVRHIKTLKARSADLGSESRFVGHLEANLIAELLRDGVSVPADCSFLP